MAIELLVQMNADTPPRRDRFEADVVTIGRDPTSVLRFDMAADVEVSTRHAEIRMLDGVWVIMDRQSTNGTWVNGARLTGVRELNVGDVVNLGRSGPELRVVQLGDQVWQQTVEAKGLPPMPEPTWRPNKTREWMVNLVETRTRAMQQVVIFFVAGIIVLGGAGWLYVRRLATDDPQVWREVTTPAIRKANDDAVVLVETVIPGALCGRGCEGTGFSIADSGLVVTNRHVVIQGGKEATAIRVKFANTSKWLVATLVRVPSDTSLDVALLKITAKGRYPTVMGLSESSADLPAGSDVMTIGFPLGSSLKMDGRGTDLVARTTVTMGSIGKVLRDLIQIDALANHGSSGSPVFDRHGHAIGVVSGGARDDDRIVYVVPSELILKLR